MTNEESFGNLISDCVSMHLKVLGFKKQGTSFYRNLSDFIQIINVQKSQWNSSEETRFVFNIGFYNAIFHNELTNLPEPKNPKEYDCFIRLRLNSITHHSDYWYSISIHSEIDKVRTEVESDIKNALIPFLEENKNFSQLYKTVLQEEWLYKQTSSINISYLHIKAGNKKEATKLLIELYEEASKPREEISIIKYPDGKQDKKLSIAGPRIEFMKKIRDLSKKYDIEINEFA